MVTELLLFLNIYNWESLELGAILLRDSFVFSTFLISWFNLYQFLNENCFMSVDWKTCKHDIDLFATNLGLTLIHQKMRNLNIFNTILN